MAARLSRRKYAAQGGVKGTNRSSRDNAEPGSHRQPWAEKHDAKRNQSLEPVADQEWKWWGYRWKFNW